MNYNKLSTSNLIKEYKNSKRKLNNKVKVEYKYLKKYHGLAYFDENRIEIDKLLSGKRLLKVLVHECAHLALGPDFTERQITRLENVIGNTLWRLGYRLKDEQASKNN